MSLVLDAEVIARETLFTPGGGGWRIALTQTRHRIELLRHMGVEEGMKVLEVGCGQGDFTVVLAAAVGPSGHVTAVDPASLDYGRPYTLGQAQEHVSSGSLGARITFVQNDPISYLSSLPPPSDDSRPFDLIVFANSLWYFSSPSQISDTLAHARTSATRIAIAEYSLCASPELTLQATPHVLAVFTQAALEVHKTETASNIRTLISPARIKALAEAQGLLLIEGKESLVTPAEDVDDSRWEIHRVRSAGFLEEIATAFKDDVVSDQRQKEVVISLRAATLAALADVPGGMKGVRMMDVWVGQFGTGLDPS